MTRLGAAAPGRRRRGDRAVLGRGARDVPVGCALALALYILPLPPVAIAGGVALVAVLALALARYHAAVALGFVLLAVQAVDPAPSDGVFAVVLAVAFATGRFRLRAVPRPIVVILTIFGALNVMATVAGRGRRPRRDVLLDHAVPRAVRAVDARLRRLSAPRARLVVRGYLAAAVLSSCLGVLALLG